MTNDFADFAEQLRRAARAESTLDHILAEEPVPLSVFVQDKEYLANPPLSTLQYHAVRAIERIYYNDMYPQLAAHFESPRPAGTLHVGTYATWRTENYWSEQLPMKNLITLQWGKGSGKDHICRVASMRIAYLLMCLRSPQEYYGLPDQDTIHLLNVASNSQQAQQAFFMPILRAVKKGWFKDRCQPKQNVISYAKNIESISGHSDAESQEGLNLLCGIADEIDAFKSKKEMQARRGASAREPTKSAEGILTMMRSSSATRFPEIYKQVRISYPRYLGSMIQQLTDEGKRDLETHGEDSRHYVSGPYATWEVNPRVKGREVFAADYRDDPIMARSKYECQPARAINPYFRNVAAVDACFAPRPQSPLTINYALDEDSRRPSWSPIFSFAPDFIPIRGAIYAMHADLAVNGDRAGIAMAHVAKFHEYEAVAEDAEGRISTVREMRPTVKVDFCTSFSSDTGADPPREIQIRWARQLCFELIRRGFNVRRFTFDAFESRDSMQILEQKGIEALRVSTDVSEEPWRNLRDLLYEGRVVIPAPERFNDIERPAPFLLREELFSLTKLPNGKVDHPVDGSKDEADAACCAIFGAVELGGQEEADDARAYLTDTDFAVGSMFDLPEAPTGFNLRAALAPVDLRNPW